MREERLQQFTGELLGGRVPDCLPDELAEVVRKIGSALAAGGGPKVNEVRLALQALNNERQFTPSHDLGALWSEQRGFDPVVEKRRVQALIELGSLEKAQDLALDSIEIVQTQITTQAKAELGEFYGQLGRIAKQRFVQSNDFDQLEEAIKWYASRYRDSDRPYFQGINVVALVAAMSRLSAATLVAEDIRLPALAEAVLVDALAKVEEDPTPWPLATASEAYVALKKCDEAELWLHRFLLHPQTQAFHIESYSRQLREIWQGNALRNNTCADRLSAIIDRHVMRTQQKWSISPAMFKTVQSDPESLEKNFSGERTFTVDVVRKMLKQCAGIGCVTDGNGRRLGTGFLVLASDFGLGSGDELIFITNAHVVSKTVPGAIAPEQAWVSFELECAAREQPIAHKVEAESLFSSPPGSLGMPHQDHLDVTLLKLRTWPEGGVALKVNTNLPLLSPKTKVFVVGHPSGDALQLSLHDSQLLDVCDKEQLLHYRTPTEPGSSGSPVFNTNWEVVALHHAGSQDTPRLRGKGSYEANEGISMRAIREAVGI